MASTNPYAILEGGGGTSVKNGGGHLSCIYDKGSLHALKAKNIHIFGTPYNAYKISKKIDNELGYPPLLSTKTPKTLNELCFDGRKVTHELFRKTSK